MRKRVLLVFLFILAVIILAEFAYYFILLGHRKVPLTAGKQGEAVSSHRNMLPEDYEIPSSATGKLTDTISLEKDISSLNLITDKSLKALATVSGVSASFNGTSFEKVMGGKVIKVEETNDKYQITLQQEQGAVSVQLASGLILYSKNKDIFIARQIVWGNKDFEKYFLDQVRPGKEIMLSDVAGEAGGQLSAGKIIVVN